MRIDFSVIGFLEFLCYYVLAAFFLRYLATRFHDRPVGKALGYLFF
jgi:hypothetical protein